MRNLRLLVFLPLWVALTGPAALHAQSNPPFQNPSLDSDCYFPQIGVPGEIDTIYGDSSGEGLGNYIHNLGPQQGGMPGNILIGNLGGDDEMVSTGPGFNLHSLHVVSRSLGLGGSSLHFAHLRNSKNVDIFDDYSWIIYWADDNGNYDTAHTTRLRSNIQGADGLLGNGGNGFSPYLTYLTSDSVEDIVLGLGTDNLQIAQDSFYLILFRGGSALANSDTAYEDTSINCGAYLEVPPNPGVQGDFRGIGRDDMIIVNYYDNVFYFKNDPPFSLEKMKEAILFDTLWTRPPYFDTTKYWPEPGQWLAMHALPKKSGDNSYDWVIIIPRTTGDSSNGIFIFRGGPDFGSHRITIDSAAYVILPPQLGYPVWPEGFVDVGDMTGTGNHILATGGGAYGSGGYTDLNYYLTGQALDNKIDVFYKNTLAGPWDTLTANADSLEDQLLGNPNWGDSSQGTIWLMYGSKQIPVHLNPQFADIKGIPQENGAGISLSPSPANAWTVATIVWPVSEDGEYSIYDMLGRQMEHGPIRLFGGAEQQRIYFSGMAQGVYIYTIAGAHGSASARFVKLGSASGSSGSSQPSIIQQMKDARDGKSDPAGLSSSPIPAIR